MEGLLGSRAVCDHEGVGQRIARVDGSVWRGRDGCSTDLATPGLRDIAEGPAARQGVTALRGGVERLARAESPPRGAS